MALAFVLGLTACGDNNGSNGKQTITVYTESGFAPFEYLNENGEVVGSDIDLMSEIPGISLTKPDGAFYVMPEVSSYFGNRFGDRVINNDGDLALYLLEEGHVSGVSGAAFCAPGYLRFSYATSDENIRKAVARIKEALAKLQ